jgi:hypothetical protein
MMRLLLIALVSLALGLAALAQQETEKKDLDGQEQAWLRWEEKVLDAYMRAETVGFGNVLRPDFKLKLGEKVFEGEEFVKAFQAWKKKFEIVDLGERAARFEGDNVISTGLVTVRERAATETATQIKGVPVVASAKAEVNVAELARKEAEKPAGPDKHVAIHPPMSIPDDLPVPHSKVGESRYRYTIVYANIRTGGKIVSLELTPAP